MSLLIFIIISLCIGCWVWKQRNRFILNSDSLHKQWLFRLAIAFPLVSSLYFIVCLGYPYPWRFDAYGYSTFLEINKFSLGILALSPILGAFVVYAHRSIQTTKQIEVTEKKNKVDIYFSTRKYINEQLNLFKTIDNEEIRQPNALYNKAFNLTNNHEDTPNKEFFDYIDNSIKTLANLFLSVRDNIIDVRLYIEEDEFRVDISTSRMSYQMSSLKKYLDIGSNSEFDLISKCTHYLEKNEIEIKNDKSNFYEFNYSLLIAGEIYSLLSSIKEIILILSSEKDIDTVLPSFSYALDSCTLKSMTVSLAE
ncbi:hypothetical protein ISO73_02630 [Morganella morganii subsp. morganii]|uniref:hypothetical protein n=1 Tax=Morganella morganii TaxID=582 RepID=UPI001BA5E7A6|nr:hypothetical protein [Morganella morganii]ELA8471741.1 hypothetical protein [Morganella morganii]MBT0449163.1 hypothetical protein [Morganella morganii subsp. morganii]MBT0507321.1 hypothetical protein [Morganella morganii subsp. morganii]MDT5423191.1 hypothetical protein [Morganella morganii]QUI28272.1 hypothetical protein H4431_03765 [Morganella morganii]